MLIHKRQGLVPNPMGSPSHSCHHPFHRHAYVNKFIFISHLTTLPVWFPESPRWLIDNNREAEALEILADLHANGDPSNALVQLEFAEIKEQVSFERTEGAKSYADLIKPGIFRRVGLGMSLQMWSQLSGMNIMMYYITYVFQGAGLSGRRGNLIASAVQYVLNVAFTVPAILYIDKWGRRPMMIWGFTLMGVFLFLVGGLQGGFGHWDRSDAANREHTTSFFFFFFLMRL